MPAPLRTAPIAARRLQARACGHEASSLLERRLVSPGFNDHIRLDEAVSQEKVFLVLEQAQALVRKVRMEVEVKIRSICTSDPRLSCAGFALENGGHVRWMRRCPVGRPQENREKPRHQIWTLVE